MSSRFKSGGGGFLNGVAGTLVGYKFDSKEWEPKKKGSDPYTTLSVELQILPDGADAPVQQFLQAGFLHDGETISDDGLTLESDSDTPIIGGDTEFAKFIDSLIAARAEFDSELDASGRNYEAMLNWRMIFKKVIDKDATEKFGKRVAKKGAHKGKEFARDYLAVDKVLDQVEAKGAKKGAAKKTTAAKPTAAAKKQADADNADDVVVNALIGILADAPKNTVNRGTLASSVVKYCLANDLNDQREVIRKRMTSDEFLALEQGWTVDAKAKTISLA